MDAVALAEVLALIGPGTYRRDRLIEHLHQLNDHFGQLTTPHLAEMAQAMREASTCGLGQAAPDPVDCVIRYFAQELATP